MKRGSKKMISKGEAPESVPSFPAWAAWYWLLPEESYASESSGFVNEFAELSWVRRQIASVIEVTDLEATGFTRIDSESTPTGSNATKQMKLSSQRSLVPPTAPKTVFLASSNRSDPIERAAEAIQQRYPQAPLRIVHGEWWAGHRRTWPISKKWTSVYWYQCHDIVLPTLLSECEDGLNRNPTIKMALAVSEDSSVRRMWLDILPQHGFQVLAASHAKGLPEGNVDVVFYDQSESDFASDIEGVRRTFPNAKIVACLGFPSWNEVKRCIDVGADFIVGKPFQIEGLSAILAERTSKL